MGVDAMVGELMSRTGLDEGQVRAAWEAVFAGQAGILADALAEGGSVVVKGFGTWDTATVKERTVSDPMTGEESVLPLSRNARFRAGPELGLRLRGGRDVAGG